MTQHHNRRPAKRQAHRIHLPHPLRNNRQAPTLSDVGLQGICSQPLGMDTKSPPAWCGTAPSAEFRTSIPRLALLADPQATAAVWRKAMLSIAMACGNHKRECARCGTVAQRRVPTSFRQGCRDDRSNLAVAQSRGEACAKHGFHRQWRRLLGAPDCFRMHRHLPEALWRS